MGLSDELDGEFWLQMGHSFLEPKRVKGNNPVVTVVTVGDEGNYYLENSHFMKRNSVTRNYRKKTLIIDIYFMIITIK